MNKIYYGIEAGGTKFICAIANLNKNGKFEILEKVRIETTIPEETLTHALDFFKSSKERYDPIALGIGSFGPLCLDKENPKYGFITSTPKNNWRDVDLYGFFKKNLGINKINFDTDVNAAAIAEGEFGCAIGISNFIYLTIGTGIGGGVIIDNQPIHGLIHPEIGHILIQREDGDFFEGTCQYHKNCLEGFCCGPAIERRAGISADKLDINNKAWDYFTTYMARGLANMVLSISPKKIILGGGVMQKDEKLFIDIRNKLKKELNQYVDHEAINNTQSGFIVPPLLKDNAGIIGSLEIAKRSTD